MTQALGVYGGYKPESSESRALGSFSADKFAYRDQQKNMIQLNNAVGYMSAYMRKMQKGIDDANQNFVQQIQGLLSEILVLFAGGGDTGFDFGDLKYIFQAIGALFGFKNGIIPINLFGAAWHFFSTYIIPVNDFTDLMDLIIDGAIASVLDIFGDVPILGQALQQLAVILSGLRDAFGPLVEALDRIFGIFNGDWLNGDFGLFDPLWEAVTNFFGVITGPILTALLPVLEMIATWSVPFIDILTNIVDVVADLIQAIPLGHLTNEPKNILVAPTFDDIGTMEQGEGWAWDGAVGRSGNGSARATAAGAVRELESGAIVVGEGQKVDVSVWLRWMGLAFTGTPIVIAIKRYSGTTFLGSQTISNINSPSVNNPSWFNVTGGYTIPAGTDRIKLSFKMNATVTAGQMWVDDASLKKVTDGIPQSWIFNLIPDLSFIGDLVKMVVDSIFDALGMVPLFGGIITAILQPFRDLIGGWFDDTEVTAGVAVDAKMGVTATQTALVQNITRTEEPLPVDVIEADAMVSQAVATQTETLVSTAAQIEKITSSSIAQGFSGTNAIEEFEYVNNTGVDVALWASEFLRGSDAIAKIKVVDGHNAGMEWTAGQSNTPVSELLHYIGPGRKSVTDYQKNSLVVGASAQGPGFGDGRRMWTWIYDRVSADRQNWVRGGVSCYGDSIIQYKRNGGAVQNLSSMEFHYGYNPGPATVLSFEAGYQGSPSIFRFLVNGQVYSSALDNSNVTAIGDLYREHGWGQETDGLNPGKLNQYTSNDNKPPGVVGSGVKIFRASGSQFGQSGNLGKLAGGCFDSIAYKTPDIDVNLATGGIKINTTGWYLFYSRFGKSTQSSSIIAGFVLYKGNNPINRLNLGGAQAITQFIPVDGVPVYVEAGDEFFWGFGTNNGSSLNLGPGDANGTEFYAGAALMNTTVR